MVSLLVSLFNLQKPDKTGVPFKKETDPKGRSVPGAERACFFFFLPPPASRAEEDRLGTSPSRRG